LKVVSDSSVLISLSSMGHLNLLRKRFPEGILVPEAVWKEVVVTGKGQPGAEEVTAANWVTVREVSDRALVSLLSVELDKGEAEVITLGKEVRADVVLVDEKDARRSAHRLGLKTLGTIGILIWAKRSGFIPNLKELLDDLQTRAKFRLSREVYDEALRAGGEL